METRTLARLILLVALVFDVAYGVATYNTPYGCITVKQAIQPPPPGGLQALAEPCFYVYYFGIVGGSTLVIFLLPAPKRTVASVEE